MIVRYVKTLFFRSGESRTGPLIHSPSISARKIVSWLNEMVQMSSKTPLCRVKPEMIVVVVERVGGVTQAVGDG